MANVLVTVCPLCLHRRQVTHALEVYDLSPVVVTEDDLLTGVAICERTGEFVWKSRDGWQTTHTAIE